MSDQAKAEPSGLARLARVDLNLLVALQVLLEERSVTRAAQRVGLSQPAMSHALKRCRQLLGDELLTRVGVGLELTPRARNLLPSLTRLLHQVAGEVLAQPGFVPGESTRRLCISVTSTTAVLVVPPLMRQLAVVAPGISVQVVPALTHGEQLVDRPGIDLLLLPDGLPSPLPRERLYNDRWVLVGAPDNDAFRNGLTAAELGEHPHVIFERDGQRTPPYALLDSLGIQPRVRIRAHDFLLIPLLLEATDLIAIIQERIARRFAAAGLVLVRPLPIEASPFGVDMVWNPRLAQDPVRPWLREELRRAVG